MTAIYVTPDKEWVKEWLPIGFEAPAEINRILEGQLYSKDKKEKAAVHLALFAHEAVQWSLNHGEALGWEIDTSVAPTLMRKDFIKETIEELEDQRINKAEKPKLYDVDKRDVDNWTIHVYAKRRKFKFPKYLPQFTSKDGFEDFGDLPADMQEHVKPIYVQEAS